VLRQNCLSGVSREKLKSLPSKILLHKKKKEKTWCVDSYYTGGCQGTGGRVALREMGPGLQDPGLFLPCLQAERQN
jgi:hypothetical protein